MLVEEPIAAEDCAKLFFREGAPAGIAGAFWAGVLRMHGGQVYGRVGQREDSCAMIGPHKLGVFALRDIRKRISPPESFPIAERAACDPGAMGAGEFIGPCPGSNGVVEIKAGEAGKLAGRILPERRDLGGEPVGCAPVVIVPMGNQFTGG